MCDDKFHAFVSLFNNFYSILRLSLFFSFSSNTIWTSSNETFHQSGGSAEISLRTEVEGVL